MSEDLETNRKHSLKVHDGLIRWNGQSLSDESDEIYIGSDVPPLKLGQHTHGGVIHSYYVVVQDDRVFVIHVHSEQKPDTNRPTVMAQTWGVSRCVSVPTELARATLAKANLDKEHQR